MLKLSKSFVVVTSFFFHSTLALSAELALDSISFFAKANVATFNVEGTASDLIGNAEFDGNLVGLEVIVPVSSLDTGIALRNSHMRDEIFTTKEGSIPNIEFVASDLDCVIDNLDGCEVTGAMSFKGKTRPLTMTLNLESTAAGILIKATAVILLSEYQIEPPSLFGVNIANEVSLDISVLVEDQ